MSIVKLFSYAAVFYFGFYSGRRAYKIWRDEYLESKRQELLSYRKDLLLIEKHLEAKDKAVRQKWQEMVSDFADYRSKVSPETAVKWNEWDDMYLNSWSSAEK